LRNARRLDVVNLDILATTRATSIAVAVAIFVELETAVAILVGPEGVGLVDLGSIGKLAVCLPVSGVRSWV